MTDPLGKEINHCYSLLFTGESQLRAGCRMKALLCFESCRKYSFERIKDSVFSYSLIRAARKETQLLREFGMMQRAYKILQKVEKVVSGYEGCFMEMLLFYSQLADLSGILQPEMKEKYHNAVLLAARRIS